jgi:hypothetical protein
LNSLEDLYDSNIFNEDQPSEPLHSRSRNETSHWRKNQVEDSSDSNDPSDQEDPRPIAQPVANVVKRSSMNDLIRRTLGSNNNNQ